MLDVSSPTIPALMPHDADAFAAFSREEIAALIANLFGILPQRGCEQRCAGCHASALPQVSSADWSTTVRAVESLAAWAMRLKITPQSGVPGALIETFRDSDPAHLRFSSADGVMRGIGDYAHLLAHMLRRPIKIMTSGVRARLQNGNLVLNGSDLDQLEQAARRAGRLSVSASIETSQYRALGEARTAEVLASTLEAILRGAFDRREMPEIFLDLMFFSPDGADPLTQRTLDLYRATVEALDSDYITVPVKTRLLDTFTRSIDGTRNQRISIAESPFGVRVSPHLNIGRAAITERGQYLKRAHPSDWLSILPGDPDDQLIVEGEHYRRADLASDYDFRHHVITHLRESALGGFLAEKVHMTGNPLKFFRAEIDLTGASQHRIAGRYAAPGITLPPGVNLLVSDPLDDELQVIIPYKPLT